jgi:hypothetical protein
MGIHVGRRGVRGIMRGRGSDGAKGPLHSFQKELCFQLISIHL